MWRLNDPQGNESSKVKYDIVPYTRGRVLEIGCGGEKAFQHFIGIDNLHHAHAFGWNIRPDIVANADDLRLIADESVDAVFSSHVLEHIQDTAKALKEWWRVLRKDGYLVLYLPHADLYPRRGQPGANPDHKHDFLPEDIIAAMKSIGGTWDLVVNEKRDADYGPGATLNEYSFLQVFQKGGSGFRESWKKPKPEKSAAVVRYGGFGDMIQAASILPGLKKQGYHVTMVTTPIGHDMLRADPHVDAFLIQDTNQVPNEELGPFWRSLSKRYDKFINLSESVEGSMLAMPGRIARYWPHQARHAYMDHNYLEVTHGIAEVPFVPMAKFYPTAEEIEWAQKERKDIGGSNVIVWSLAGSSVHKAWPHIDMIIARLLVTYAGVRIVMVGDNLAKMLEGGWENEPRVLLRCGEWSIRQTLTFALKEADLVIGPETGVLNAVGLEDVKKIVTLSHSSEENLTKHWKNCIALTPENTPCYPCHMLHYDFSDCRRGPNTGVSLCQENISPDVMWLAILQQLPAPLIKEAG